MRVWPSGNWASGPSESQDSYPGLRSRITGERIYRTIGTARITPTAPLRRIPSFISIPRLESSSGKVIEFLLPVAGHLHKAGPGTVAAARQSKPRHRRHPLETSACRARRCANRERLCRAARQLQWSEDFGRSPVRDRSHPRWNWLAYLRGRLLRDTTSSKRYKRRLRAADHRVAEPHKAEDERHSEHPAWSSGFEFH